MASSYLLTEIPLELRRKLSEQAARSESSIAQVVRKTLCERYGIEDGIRARRREADIPARRFVIRADPALFDALKRDASRRGRTMRQVILEILEEKFEDSTGKESGWP